MGRYADCEKATLVLPGGSLAADLLPRTAPPTGQGVLTRHRVVPGDRPDLIAAQYLGDPTAFWAVCDANRVLDPDELTASEGVVIDIPAPGG